MKLIGSTLVGAFLLGCSSVPDAPTVTPTDLPTATASATAAPTSTATHVVTPLPTAVPATSTLVPPTATVVPTPTVVPPTPTATATDDDEFPIPPDGLLRLPGGEQQAGKLGTYCYRGGCADSPYWPTARSMTRVDLPAAGAPLSFALADDREFVYWRASYAARDDHFAEAVWQLDSGGEIDGEQRLTKATFAAPPSGKWLLNVSVWLPPGRDGGDLHFYWYVVVP